MSAKYPFKYSETLGTPALRRLPERLHIKGAGDPELLLIVRLLSGAARFEHIKSDKTIKQNENYFSEDLKGYGQRWDTKFPKLVAENYTSSLFSEFIESTRFQNKSFYKNILAELSYYFYYQAKGGHATAFVFLYRALEHISYAFPLIYASKTDDFSKTFRFLQELMSGDKKSGELGFFKSFIRTGYKDDPIFESSVDFPITLETESEQKKTFNILKELCKGNMIADATEKPRILSVHYVEIGSFIIELRNRFFHYMNGSAKNIETSNISDVDILFSLVNKKFLYWLSTVFLAVFSHAALDFESIRTRIA